MVEREIRTVGFEMNTLESMRFDVPHQSEWHGDALHVGDLVPSRPGLGVQVDRIVLDRYRA